MEHVLSKFNGTCSYCNRPTKAGLDHYDLDKKSSYHETCDPSNRSLEQAHALADRLGFSPAPK